MLQSGGGAESGVRFLRAWRRLSFVIGFWAVVLSANPGLAQDFRASISGQVSDPSGAVIQGATIGAVNLDTQVAYSTKSNREGVYSLLYMLPGMYRVTIEAANFETMTYDHVRLDSAQQFGLNVTLKTGSVSEQVVVTADSAVIDTVSATSGGVIDQQRVENMPATGLMVWDDLAFTQGLRSTSAPFNLTPRNNSNTYAASGDQVDENAFYVNGAPVSDQGNWYFVPSQASTQQLQAEVMPYDAQYGRTGGGAFNVTVKSGTDGYHGSVYDYYGNQALNGNTWLADLTGIRKPVNIRDTFGAETGGPILKGKTFYFGSYEGFRQNEPVAIRESVPLPAWIQGNFQGSGYTIYDPLSTHCAKTDASGACTLYARTPFPNNQIPQGSINKIGQAILALYPAPNLPGTEGNYVTVSPTTFQYDQFIGRMDHNFTDNTRIYGLFLYQKNGNLSGGNAFPDAATTSSTSASTDYNVILDLTRILSPKKVLDLKGSYGHFSGLNTSGVAIADNFLASKLGFNMPAVATTTHQNIVPTMSVANETSLFGNTANGTAHVIEDFTGSMTQLIGRHSLHYGGEYLDTQNAPTGVLGNPNGTFSFNANFTQGNPLKATTGQGNAIADVLLGYPSSGSVSWTTPTFVTMHYYAAFIQDDVKVLKNLSLNLGLRWDVNKSPRDRHNAINAGFCLTCVNPLTSQINFANSPTLENPLMGGFLFAGVNGAPSEPYKVEWNDWQPRVGFSWAPMRNTVIRGGYGIYDPWASPAVDDTGFSRTTGFVDSLDGSLTPDNYFSSGTPYPNGVLAPTGASLGLATGAGSGLTFHNTQRRLRMTQHWSFGIQRTLPGSMLLDVEYMGTSVHSIPMTSSLGVISTAEQQACNANASLCTASVPNPFYGVLDPGTSLGASPTIPAYKLARSYPLFDGLSEQQVPLGSSHYNALDVRVERRVHNLNFVFNYIYSNWVDRDSFLNSGNFQDAAPVTSLDPNDRRNYIDGNFVYPLPSLRKSGLLGALLDHWLVDATTIWGTGAPLSLPGADFNWGAPGCSSYAPPGGQTRAHWFNNNESCWTQLGAWTARTTPLNTGFIREPETFLENFAFHKQFKLPREGMFLQYRMEAWNAINHPTWQNANTTVATAAAFSPKTSWTGFGTLPSAQSNIPRNIIASLKVIF